MNRLDFNRRPSLLSRYLRQRLPPQHRQTCRAPRDHPPLQLDPHRLSMREETKGMACNGQKRQIGRKRAALRNRPGWQRQRPRQQSPPLFREVVRVAPSRNQRHQQPSFLSFNPTRLRVRMTIMNLILNVSEPVIPQQSMSTLFSKETRLSQMLLRLLKSKSVSNSVSICCNPHNTI